MSIDAASAPGTGRPLRRDAQRNRDALLTAAQEAFAEHGLDASLEQVARRAGVAIGTLYRHFPTRIDLVQSVLMEKVRAWEKVGERAAAMGDAWEGLCLYLETMCELQADDRGFNDVAVGRLPASADFEEAHRRIGRLSARLIERAQRQGAVRADITVEDLAFVVWSHSEITRATHGIAPRVWRRHLHLMLDAFRADRAHPLPEPPLTTDQLHRAMHPLKDASSSTGAPAGD
ncbi:TetR/AcrR family transcriptional regulator [Nonomuraea sp. NPDC003201]